MPKPVHDMVDKMLADESFYPNKSKEDRESAAWAIAYSKYKKRKKKSYWIIDGKLIKTALDVKIHQAKLADFLGNFKKADSIDNLIRLSYNDYDYDEEEDWHAQSGEYWIDQYGGAHYADSDVGNIGHDDLAEQEILSRLGFDTEEVANDPYQEIEVLNKFVADDLLDSNMHRSHMKSYHDYLTEQKQEHDLHNYLRFLRRRTTPSENPDKYHHETESLIKGLNDARTYARQNFGWIRVVKRGNVVDLELEKLTPSVLKNIQSSLGEIAGYDENLDRLKFNIEVYSPKQVSVNNVSLKDIESGNVLSLYMKELREQLPPQVAEEYYKNFFGTVGHPYYRGRVGD